jgi:hypothetical protein
VPHVTEAQGDAVNEPSLSPGSLGDRFADSRCAQLAVRPLALSFASFEREFGSRGGYLWHLGDDGALASVVNRSIAGRGRPRVGPVG